MSYFEQDSFFTSFSDGSWVSAASFTSFERNQEESFLKEEGMRWETDRQMRNRRQSSMKAKQKTAVQPGATGAAEAVPSEQKPP